MRRHDDEVIWEPYPTSPRATIDTSYTFDLCQYLDAVDAGQASTGEWESRPRLLARELRRRRDSLFGFDIFAWHDGKRVMLRLLDVGAWPGFDHISLTVATPNGVRQLKIPVSDDLTDDEIIAQAAQAADEQWDI